MRIDWWLIAIHTLFIAVAILASVAYYHKGVCDGLTKAQQILKKQAMALTEEFERKLP